MNVLYSLKMKNAEIESKLFELVKGCINNEDFMVNQKETGRNNYGYGGPFQILTGVRINTTSVNTRYEEHGKCDYKQAYYISLDFEHEPSIYINYERISEERTVEGKLITVERVKYNWLIDKITNLFIGKSYTEIVKNEIIIRKHKYVLTCGEFKVDLTDEQVEELVELYNINIVEFRKNKQASEIVSRMKKFIK